MADNDNPNNKDRKVNGYSAQSLIERTERSQSTKERELESRLSGIQKAKKNDPALSEVFQSQEEEVASKLSSIRENRASLIASSLDKQIRNQFSEREYQRQVNISSREVSSGSQYRNLTYAEIAGQQYSADVGARKTIADARSAQMFEMSSTGAVGAIGNVYDQYKERQTELAQQAGGLQAAAHRKKRRGLDPLSMIEEGESIVSKEGSRLEGAQLAKDVASGKYDRAEEEKKLNKSGEQLAKTLEKLTKAFETFDASSSESIETLATAEREFEKISKEYDHQAKVVKEIKNQGGSAGDSARQMLGVASAGVDALRYQFVTSNVQQNNARAGYANIQNERFFDQLAATKGDAGALRRTMSGFHDYANDQFGLYKGMSTGLGAADVAAQGADAYLSAYNAEGLFNPGNKAAEIAGKAGQAYKTGVGLAKGISQYSDAASARDSIRALDTATNAVGDTAMQSFINYNQSMGQALVGAGSAGGFDAVKGQLSALADSGVSPQEAARLFAQGSSQIGTSFLKNPNMMSRAGEMRSMGIMSAEQYLGGVGQLTQAGGGQKDMETILSNAVARGVDNAKSISGMVAGITSLSSSMASEGVSNVAGNSQLFMSRLDALQGRGLSEEMSQAMAMKGAGDISKMTSDTGLNIFTMQEQSGYSNQLSNISLAGRTNVQSVDHATLKSLQTKLAKGGEEAKQAKTEMMQLGLAEFSESDLGKAVGVKEDTIATRMAQAGGISYERAQGYVSGKIKVDDLSAAEQAAVRMNTGSGILSYGNIGGTATSETATGAKGTDKADIDLKRAESVGELKLVQSVDQLGMDIGTLTKAMNGIAEKLDPSKAQAESVGAAMGMTLDKESLSNFKDGAADLKKAATELRDAIRPITGAFVKSGQTGEKLDIKRMQQMTPPPFGQQDKQ
jgi:hypothetical protein